MRRPRQHAHAVVVDQGVVGDHGPATFGSDLDSGGGAADECMVDAHEAAGDRDAGPRAIARGDAGEVDERAGDADTRRAAADQRPRAFPVGADDDGAGGRAAGTKIELLVPRAAPAQEETVAAAQADARCPGE